MDKQAAIFDSALKMFVEQGFHGTATAKIAQKAGVANGTLFNYFKTKEDLIIALYVSVKDEMAEYVAQHIGNQSDLKRIMNLQFVASLTWAIENPLKFRFVQQFHTSPYLSKLDRKVLQSQVQPHLGLIEKGIKAKVLKKMPSDFIYMVISNHTFGLYQYIMSKKMSKQEQQQTIQKTFDMLWDMLT